MRFRDVKSRLPPKRVMVDLSTHMSGVGGGVRPVEFPGSPTMADEW